MQEETERQNKPEKDSGENIRPQRGGEGATTRLGMEDSDKDEIPATGGPQDDEAPEPG